MVSIIFYCIVNCYTTYAITRRLSSLHISYPHLSILSPQDNYIDLSQPMYFTYYNAYLSTKNNLFIIMNYFESTNTREILSLLLA